MNTKPTIVFFCTYKNKETKDWQKSREYQSVISLMNAMAKYLESHPTIAVQFQKIVVYV